MRKGVFLRDMEVPVLSVKPDSVPKVRTVWPVKLWGIFLFQRIFWAFSPLRVALRIIGWDDIVWIKSPTCFNHLRP